VDEEKIASIELTDAFKHTKAERILTQYNEQSADNCSLYYNPWLRGYNEQLSYPVGIKTAN
jgi:hypothetical protein